MAKFDPPTPCTPVPPSPTPWRPHALHPGAIQGKEGIKFCHLATLGTAGIGGRPGEGGHEPDRGESGGGIPALQRAPQAVVLQPEEAGEEPSSGMPTLWWNEDQD